LLPLLSRKKSAAPLPLHPKLNPKSLLWTTRYGRPSPKAIAKVIGILTDSKKAWLPWEQQREFLYPASEYGKRYKEITKEESALVRTERARFDQEFPNLPPEERHEKAWTTVHGRYLPAIEALEREVIRGTGFDSIEQAEAMANLIWDYRSKGTLNPDALLALKALNLPSKFENIVHRAMKKFPLQFSAEDYKPGRLLSLGEGRAHFELPTILKLHLSSDEGGTYLKPALGWAAPRMNLPPNPEQILKDWEIQDTPDGELLLTSEGPGTGRGF
jgi:hypothetical protein